VRVAGPALCAFLVCLATGCATTAGRAAPDERAIAVAAARSWPHVSVAHDVGSVDHLPYWMAPLLFPLARDAARGAEQVVRSIQWSGELRATARPELNLQLADAVLRAGRAGLLLVHAPPADDGGCGAPSGGPSRGETLHVEIIRIAFVGDGHRDAPLGVAAIVRGVLRGAQGSCVERAVLVASEEEMPFDAWVADDRAELAAELEAQIALAGPRILAAVLEER
jgi:hypothetical protein